MVGLPLGILLVSLTLSRQSFLVLAPSAAPAVAAATGDTTVIGDGFTLKLPTSYYRPSGGNRGKTGLFDDLVFVAADYPKGRTVSVSKTDASQLLIDSGDAIAVESGPLKELRELGRPQKIASLLASRRAGDPVGVSSRGYEIVSVVQNGNELRFVVRELVFKETSMTTAMPSSRTVQARTLFVPGGSSAFLLTVWASSSNNLDAVQCTQQPCNCGEGASLNCDCPTPVCSDVSGAIDVGDLAIVNSLRLVD